MTVSARTSTALPAARPTRSRPPVAVLAATGLQLLFAGVTTFGVFYFSLVDAARPPLAVGLALVAVYWSMNAIGIAGSIGLLRRRDLGRKLLAAYAVYEILFSAVKIVFFHESPSWMFGALSVVLLALTFAPATRRWTV